MTTEYTGRDDHYVPKAERDKLHAAAISVGLTVSQLAYELRMSRTHVSCMLSGTQKMAYVHKLAIQWVIVMKRREQA